MFMHQEPTCASPLLLHITCLAHLIILDLITEWYWYRAFLCTPWQYMGDWRHRSIQFHPWRGGEMSDLGSGRFNHGENSLGGPQRRFGCFVEEKISCLCRQSNHDSSIVNPV